LSELTAKEVAPYGFFSSVSVWPPMEVTRAMRKKREKSLQHNGDFVPLDA